VVARRRPKILAEALNPWAVGAARAIRVIVEKRMKRGGDEGNCGAQSKQSYIKMESNINKLGVSGGFTRTISSYRRVEQIGEGTYGQVYK